MNSDALLCMILSSAIAFVCVSYFSATTTEDYYYPSNRRAGKQFFLSGGPGTTGVTDTAAAAAAAATTTTRRHLLRCRDKEMEDSNTFEAFPKRNTSGVHIRGWRSQPADKKSVRGKLLVDVNSCAKAMVDLLQKDGGYDFEIMSLPMDFIEKADEFLMKETLTYKCEKKALALQLILGKHVPGIVINTRICEDSHNLYRAASAYFRNRISCEDGREGRHVFTNGECSCNRRMQDADVHPAWISSGGMFNKDSDEEERHDE